MWQLTCNRVPDAYAAYSYTKFDLIFGRTVQPNRGYGIRRRGKSTLAMHVFTRRLSVLIGG
jgi:hypothetical protein